jgi:hypothetical protein
VARNRLRIGEIEGGWLLPSRESFYPALYYGFMVHTGMRIKRGRQSGQRGEDLQRCSCQMPDHLDAIQFIWLMYCRIEATKRSSTFRVGTTISNFGG